jgi:hypothetical protein
MRTPHYLAERPNDMLMKDLVTSDRLHCVGHVLAFH